MVEYILGNYLIQSGKLTDEYFNGIIEKLDKVHVRLGIIAVAEGMMSIEQADEINQLQSAVDKRFGDIAIEKGYLTEAQINNLLKAQGNTFMTFIQALVNEGFINLREIDNILEAFRIKNSFSKTDMEILKRNDTDVVIPLFLTNETLQYQDIISIAIRTIIRCIDRHVYIGKASLLNGITLHNASVQLVDGENGFVSAFAEKDGDGNHAAVVKRKRRIVPDIFTEQNVVVKFCEFRSELAENGVSCRLCYFVLSHKCIVV